LECDFGVLNKLRIRSFKDAICKVSDKKRGRFFFLNMTNKSKKKNHNILSKEHTCLAGLAAGGFGAGENTAFTSTGAKVATDATGVKIICPEAECERVTLLLLPPVAATGGKAPPTYVGEGIG
jgi:hypothetical protein